LIPCLLSFCLALSVLGCGMSTTETTIASGSLPTDTNAAPAVEQTQAPGSVTINPTLAALASLILFRDGFQDGNMDYWKVTGGWSIFQDDEAYHILGTSSGGAFVPWGLEWTDYVLRAAFRLDFGGVGFNYMLTNSGRYIILLHEKGTYLAKESPPGTVTVLAQAPAPALGKWHWLAIASQEGHLQVFIDRQLIIDVTDQQPLLAGTIGLGALNDSQAYVDDVLVAKRINSLTSPGPTMEQTVAAPNQAVGAPVIDLPVVEIAGPALAEVQLDQDVPMMVVSSEGLVVMLQFLINGDTEASLQVGECATLTWNVDNVIEVTLNGEPVMASGELSICPTLTTTYTLRALDLNGGINQASVVARVSGGGQVAGGSPDLAVSGVSASDGQVFTAIPISITIVNNGTASAGGFSVAVQDNGPNTPIGTMVDVAQLPAGASVTVNGMLFYASAGSHTALITVDYFSAVPDSNRSNNGATVAVQVSGDEPPPPPPPVIEPPGAPNSCMSIGISSSAAQVAWAWGSNADGYYVLRDGSTVATLPASSSSWIVDGLAPGTTYNFEVVAFNSAGQSPSGACTASATTSPAAEPPPEEPPAESTATDTLEPIPTETETTQP
jgi:hypothetical protein